MRKRIKKAAAQERFTKNSQGVIRDRQTGLEWYEGPDEDTDWYDARCWVDDLTVDGGGWRMPSRSELKGLYEEDAGGGLDGMDPCFENMGGWYIWSGEADLSPWDDDPDWPDDNDSSSAWYFDFPYREYLCYCDDADHARALAVRTRR